MSKIVDLNAYREKVLNANDDHTIIQEVVDDAVKELITSAVWIAKDLDVDIENLEFVAHLSGAYHYFSQALELGLGIKPSANEDHLVIAEDVKTWNDEMKKGKGEDDE